MSEVQEVQVLSIKPIIETETGDILHAVSFGNYIKIKDIRTFPVLEELKEIGNEVPVQWLFLITKQMPVPYLVGSWWKLTVMELGAFQLELIKD